MMLSPFMFSALWTGALVNHLWQSTVVTFIAWLLTLTLKNNQARTRFLIWMIASVKFLLPFSLLITAGEWLRSALATPVQRPAFAAVMEQITQTFPQTSFPGPSAVDYFGVAPTAPTHRDLLPVILVATWLCGFLAIAISWARSWWQIRAAVHTGSPMTLLAGVPVLSSPRSLEPGIFGIIHPVLLLPENISGRLSAAQLNAIVAHEMCHVRRRDNLTAAVHMVVAAAFWFHPAVWWIKARLLDERERACDEAVLHSGNQAQLYAESILNVCKFYVEAPMACMSGVTGSDLKRRIVRIMSEQAARKLDWGRKLLLCAAGMATVAAPVVFGLVHITRARAQATAQNAGRGIADTWQGTFHVDRDLRVVFKISKVEGGGYTGVCYTIDQDGNRIPVEKITLEGTTVKMSLPAIGGTYEGKLSGDGKTITGTWTQGSPLSLTLTRATPETEWTIPPLPPRLPPMDANANSSFEVATIKPSKPNQPGKGFGFRGDRFNTRNTNLNDLVQFAYGLHDKQLVGAPAWFGTDLYDIEAKPDAEGRPSQAQMRTMVQKLLADRFKLTFHHDKRELSVFVISVASGGPKMTKSTAMRMIPPPSSSGHLGI